jgi:hypothetical protein
MTDLRTAAQQALVRANFVEQMERREAA